MTRTPGCTPGKQVYTCDRDAFQRALNNAKTATIDVSPRDRLARGQLKDLIATLGKTLQSTDTPADLIFVLSPPNAGTVEIGPVDQPVGSLLVYAALPDGSRGNLLWGDTYRSQPDLPWPAVIHALISEFQAKFGKG